MLTQEALHNEALTRFAALTRHKDNPASLEPPFATKLSETPPREGETGMSLTFGKRFCMFTFLTSDLNMSIQEFGDRYLDRAVRELLDSRG